VKRFAPAQLERFLGVLDDNLERNVQITIIGGSALAARCCIAALCF
jgi:hypothetical protein